MKISKLFKLAAVAGVMAVASNAQAGVRTTAYLELNNLFVQFDQDNDGNPDQVNPLDVIQLNLSTGSRETSSFANYNGNSVGDAQSGGPIAPSDTGLVCSGPSCGALGLTNNGQSLDAGTLVQNDAYHFAAGDAQVTGNALGQGATGFTYAESSIASGNNELAAANSNIANSILSTITFDVTGDVRLRFSALLDYVVKAFISADIANDATQQATASAKVTFGLELLNLGTGSNVSIANAGFTRNSIAIDAPGLGDISGASGNNEDFFTGWTDLSAGLYQLTITQSSTVQSTLVPAPASLAITALGLLGLGFTARRRKQK